MLPHRECLTSTRPVPKFNIDVEEVDEAARTALEPWRKDPCSHPLVFEVGMALHGQGGASSAWRLANGIMITF